MDKAKRNHPVFNQLYPIPLTRRCKIRIFLHRSNRLLNCINMEVKAWAKDLDPNTLSPAEKNPMFLEKRVYQGSAPSSIPHP